MAVVIQYSEVPKAMWDGLHDRYDSTSDFCKAQVLASVTQKQYTGQPMDEYLAEWEFADAHLKTMNAALNENTLITLFFESFGGSSSQSYGNVITALQTSEYCTWKDV